MEIHERGTLLVTNAQYALTDRGGVYAGEEQIEPLSRPHPYHLSATKVSKNVKILRGY